MTNNADLDQKPIVLDLHCLLRLGMSCSAREGLILQISICFVYLRQFEGISERYVLGGNRNKAGPF